MVNTIEFQLLIALTTDLDYIENKSFSNNYSKNNSNISNEIGGEKFRTKEKLRIEKKLKIKDLKGFE